MDFWSQFICRGKCYVGDGDRRCREVDPETGVRCSLNRNHLTDPNHAGYSVRHIHCSEDRHDVSRQLNSHGIVVWAYDKKFTYLKKTRAPRSIRVF